MSFETWFAFALASAVVVAIPGPTVLLVVSYALGHGRRPALAIVAGVGLGDFTAMTASILGIGALLATSAALSTAAKRAVPMLMALMAVFSVSRSCATSSARGAGMTGTAAASVAAAATGTFSNS